MPKIISTHSFRGGTGKSNTTANLAVMVARAGYRVGVIDTDIQSPGVHVVFQLEESSFRYSLNDYLWGRCQIQDAAYDVTDRSIGKASTADERPRIFLIPSSMRTGEIARILREGYEVSRLNDGLHDVIKELNLDFLFIDTHPGVNEETLLSIAISDALVLIVRPDKQDLQGTAVAVELARRLELKKMLMIINKVPQGVDSEQLKSHIESLFKAEVAAVLPLNNEMAQIGSSCIFANRYPDHPFTIGLKHVAQLLIG